MNKNWKIEYKKYSKQYKAFQKEVKDFVDKIVKQHKNDIDIVKVVQRPRGNIKTIKSIENNLDRSNYKKFKSIVDIKDIAGIRTICHCEDDVKNLSTIFGGELRKIYLNVEIKDIGGVDSRYPYHATHISFSKKIKNKEGQPVNIFCEIQVCTVLADAWAIQNSKYIYKKQVEGEANQLTIAVSEIMNGCEKLWSLVKKKSLSEKEKPVIKKEPEVAEILVKEDQTKKPSNDYNIWIKNHRGAALKGLRKLNIKAYMEVQSRLLSDETDVKKIDLKKAARDSNIHTFGWPIAVYLENREGCQPKVDLNGIHAEISIKERFMDSTSSYDYWAIKTDGAFFLFKSIFEDSRDPQRIFFNTRIVRITEVFMYLKNLYEKLEISINTPIEISITHGGIKNRVLTSASPNRMLFRTYRIDTDPFSVKVFTTTKEISEDIVSVVERVTTPFFEQFDFFQLDRKVLEDIVINYANGKVV